MREVHGSRHNSEKTSRAWECLQDILLTLLNKFDNIGETIDERSLLEGVLPALKLCFKAQVVFLAQRDGGSSFQILSVTPEGSQIVPKGPVKSNLLKKASRRRSPLFCVEARHWSNEVTNSDPLFKLGNIAVSLISFGDGKEYLLTVAAPNWTAEELGILGLICELVFLAIENKIRGYELFRSVCQSGDFEQTSKIAQRVLSDRMNLAYLARERRDRERGFLRHNSPEPPVLDGEEFDHVLSQLIDSERYIAGKRALGADSGQQESAVKRLALFMDPVLGEKTDIVHLYMLSSSRSGLGEGQPSRDESHPYRLGEDTFYSRLAVSRALLWIAYKQGCLLGGAQKVPDCILRREMHKNCDGKKSCCMAAFEKYVPLPIEDTPDAPLLGHRSRTVGYLRTLWLEVYYRARLIRESQRRPKDEGPLGGITGRFLELRKKTAEFFLKVLSMVPNEHPPYDVQPSQVDIDWRWLYLWFLSRALASDSVNQCFDGYSAAKTGLDVHLDHYTHVSTAVLFGLHLLHYWNAKNMPVFSDLPEIHDRAYELVKARIYLLTRYAYEEIGVDRAWHLEHHLHAQFQPEMVLYASSPGHRDHAFHVIDVCLLGDLLISSVMDRTLNNYPSAFADMILHHSGESLKDLLKKWYPAALLHDSALGASLAAKIPNLLKRFETKDIKDFRDKLDSDLKESYKSLDENVKNAFLWDDLLFDQSEGLGKDHGILSANHLLRSFRHRKGMADSEKIDPAARVVIQTILRHNSRKEAFSVAKEPLSFLLMLCDHLHEFGRTRVKPEQMARAFLSSFQMGAPLVAQAERTALSIGLNAWFDKGDLKFTQGEGAKFTVNYESSRARLMEPACQWVEFVADFEKVTFPYLSPVVDVIFVHPEPGFPGQAAPERMEMQIMRDYAGRDDGSFLGDWLAQLDKGVIIDYSEKPCGEISKELAEKYGKDTKMEVFTAHLSKRIETTPKALHYMPEDFYTAFFIWKENKLGFPVENLL